MVDWLEKSVEKASELYFHKKHCCTQSLLSFPFLTLFLHTDIGEGGTIPFMGMLGAMFPKAQFVITGLLGPASNAHGKKTSSLAHYSLAYSTILGPNEFLHIQMGKNVTSCVVNILADHAEHLTH